MSNSTGATVGTVGIPQVTLTSPCWAEAASKQVVPSVDGVIVPLPAGVSAVNAQTSGPGALAVLPEASSGVTTRRRFELGGIVAGNGFMTRTTPSVAMGMPDSVVAVCPVSVVMS